MNRLFLLFLFFLAIPLIQSCATADKSMIRKDPLIGKIINTRIPAESDFDSLIREISAQDVIYLSEKHDNPDHHIIQERILRQLVENGLTPTIGFEFFSMEETPDLLNFVDSGKIAHAKKTERFIEQDLRRKLGWDTQPDDMWQYYYTLLTLARKENLPVAGIDLSATLKKRITRKGLHGLTPLEKESIFSTGLSNEAYKAYMFSIFKAVHCGMGHEKMQSRLYDTWVARNDAMAQSITRLYRHRKGPVIIIIGGGHTEYGLGVMDRVKAMDKTIRQVNLALREISVTPSSLPEYLVPLELEGFESVSLADYVWFTQRTSYTDPCVEFKKSLKKMKSSPGHLKE